MPRLDASIQVRIEMRMLATLVKHYAEEGNFAAIKNPSTLVRAACMDIVQQIVQKGGRLLTAIEAEEVLQAYALLPRVARSGQLGNMREEVLAAEPHAKLGQRTGLQSMRQELPTATPRESDPDERFREAAMAALASPRVQRAVEEAMREQARGQQAQVSDAALRDGECVSKEADEGEFSAEALHALRTQARSDAQSTNAHSASTDKE